MFKTILTAAVFIGGLCAVQAAEHQERLALLIGNSAYLNKEVFLPNPVNDASDLAAVLAERLNFNVTVKQNLSREQMQTEIELFGHQLRVAGGMGLFYYAGHGMQFRGENFLIPIGAEQALFSPNYDVEHKTIKASDISATLKTAANQVNIIILDACRDNPFQFRGRERRPTPPGLSQMVAPGGSLMAYAARANEVASDGKGKRNSPYAASLIEQINQSQNLSVMQLFTQVRAAVVKKTGGFQAPGFYSELNQDFCLVGECVENRPDIMRQILWRMMSHWQLMLATVIAIWILWLGWRFNWVDAVVEGWTEYRAEKIQLKQAQLARQQAAIEERKRQAQLARQQASAEKERKRQAQLARQQAAEEKRKRQAQLARQQATAIEERRKSAPDGKLFEFKTVSVNAKGKIIHRETKQARSKTEDLGNGVTLDMVYIPEGTFLMGSPETEEERYDDEQQHQVTLEPFWMAKYLVTQAQWQAIMGNNPSYFKGDQRPVEQVSWNDSVEFCERLSEITGDTYRLPSEAQWEYACRAGTTTPFYFGPTITTKLANYDGNYPYGSAPKGVYRQETTDVGSFPPNAFGLYDMHGNVWEWCADPWHDSYKGAPTDGSVWEEGGDSGYFVLRGGAWDSNATWARSAIRSGNDPTYRYNYYGFRPARIL